MINLDNPFTYENSENPWLMNHNNESALEINNKKITADYLWTLSIEQRIQCLNDVFLYYRKNGFPYERYNDEHIIKQFNKLKQYNSFNIINSDGFISNSGSLCLDVCRHFCYDKFWKASSEKMLSIEDVFNNDELFLKVLKNRMGWNTTKEDSSERPYMFTITDKMIRTGIRNSGQGYGVSNFRPTIAKFIYEKYLSNIYNPTVFDYSAGWGARALAAASLNYNYYATDPLTADNINNIYSFLKNNNLTSSTIKVFNSGSEISETYKNIPLVDMCMSCPPYFNLEVYSDNKTQSYNEHNNFEEWIKTYWTETVNNCNSILKKDGYFVLIIKDYYKDLPLKEQMENVVNNLGYTLIDTYQYKTTTNHLSSKIKTGKKSKTSEYVIVWKK